MVGATCPLSTLTGKTSANSPRKYIGTRNTRQHLRRRAEKKSNVTVEGDWWLSVEDGWLTEEDGWLSREMGG